MFQARQMLTESMDGVALSDDSVVGAYTKKWGPVLEGMEHEIADFPGLGRRMVRHGETMEIYDMADGRPMDSFALEEVGGEEAPD